MLNLMVILMIYNYTMAYFEIMMAFLTIAFSTMSFFTMAFFTMAFIAMAFLTMAFSETHHADIYVVF